MSVIKKYCLVLNHNNQKLTIPLLEDNVEAVEQLMNCVLFNFPGNMNLIEVIKSTYQCDCHLFCGCDLIEDILHEIPESKTKLICLGEGTESLKTQTLFYKSSVLSVSSQKQINNNLNNFGKIKFDGLNVTTNCVSIS